MNSSAAEIYADIRTELPHTPEIRAEIDEKLKEIADQAEAFAKDIAPVLKSPDPREKAGSYRDSIHVERRRDHEGFPAYRLISRDSKAHWIEFGTRAGTRHGATPEFAVFAKTAQHFGGDLGEGIGVPQRSFL